MTKALLPLRSSTRTVALGTIIAALVCASAEAQPSPTPRTVLAVFFSSEDYPANPVRDAGIRDGLLTGADTPIDYFTEYLESDRFPEEQASLALREYLRDKYRDRHIDAVLAVTDTALTFVLRHRDALFPDAPIVYYGNVPPANARQEPSMTGVVVGDGFNETLRLALTLHPSTQRAFIVAQVPNLPLQNSVLDQLRHHAPHTQLSYIAEASVPRLLAAVRAVPSNSIILYIRHSQETPGRVLFSSEVARLVAAASPVPVYGVSDMYVGSGIVGGTVFDTRAVGVRLGAMVRQVLDGARPQDIPIERAQFRPIFDWRQLQRWHIDASRLPAGSEIRFRTSTVWESHRWYIVGAVSVFVLQMLLIGGLLVQHASRKRAEAAIRDKEAALRTSYEETRQLAGRIIGAQEVERARIARELHDDISQKVALLAMDIHQVSKGASLAVVGRVNTMAERASEIATDLHNLSHELHPAKLQILGLVPATQCFCRDFAARHNLTVDFTHDRMPPTVSADSALCLFRIAQEALQNVAKHSGTKNASVRLTGEDGFLHLEVLDSGAGFDAQKLSTGMGLLSMRERVYFIGGDMDIWSMPGAGTQISVRVPVPSSPAAANRTVTRIA